jgi:RNA polymerase sigma factor (sigma-70 family)
MKEPIHINSRIIDKCLQGDIKAQYQLYRQFSKAMYNIAIRMLNNKMDAEDILQDSFIAAFSRLHELERKEAFPGWLRMIVINKCISFQRKMKVRFKELEDDRFGEDEKDALDDPLQRVDPSVVHHAFRNLPSKGRMVVVLHALEGYKHREIAELLGISESTSKTQYSRALGLLKNALKENIDVQ